MSQRGCFNEVDILSWGAGIIIATGTYRFLCYLVQLRSERSQSLPWSFQIKLMFMIDGKRLILRRKWMWWKLKPSPGFDWGCGALDKMNTVRPWRGICCKNTRRKVVPWSNVGLAIDKCAQRARSQRSTLGNPPANADRGCFNCYHCLELALIALLIGGASAAPVAEDPGAMGRRDLSEDYSGSTMAKTIAPDLYAMADRAQTLEMDLPSISRSSIVTSKHGKTSRKVSQRQYSQVMWAKLCLLAVVVTLLHSHTKPNVMYNCW